MRKIFITGANGFVASHLIPILQKDNFIVGLIRSVGKKKNIPNVEFVTGNILEGEELYSILKKYQPDCIVHLAGIAQTHKVDPLHLFSTNFFGTYNLFEAVSKLKKISGYSPKIVHISSSDIYGKTTHPDKINENDPLNPVNYYGVSKLAGDRLAFQYSQSVKLRVVIFRPFPHSGPRQKLGFFVPDMVSQLVKLENNSRANKLMVGNLEAIRDYLDVRDVVRAYKKTLDLDLEPGSTYNVCSGKGIKISEILDILLMLIRKKIKVVPDSVRMRSSEIPIMIGDNLKIKKDLNWQAEINIKQTLEDSLNYWRQFGV